MSRVNEMTYTKRILATAPLCFLAVCVTASYASPITTTDQQNTVGGTTNSGNTGFGQSFMPTLSSIGAAEFSLSGAAATVGLTLYSGSGTGGAVLGTSGPVVIGTTGFGTVHFDFASAISLTPGNLYTLFVRTSAGTIGENFSTDNPYSRGMAFNFDGTASPIVDVVFSEGTTTVVTSAAPEASTWLLVAGSLVGLGLWNRSGGRRRR